MALSLRERVAAKRENIEANKAGGTKPYKFKAGKTAFRILPSLVDGKDEWRDYGLHFIKDGAGDLKAVVGDRSIAYGTTDPIREELLAYAKTLSDKDEKKKVYDCLAKHRVIVNGLILAGDDDTPKDKPVLLDFSINQFDEILSILQIYIDADEDPFDLATGTLIIVEKTGSGLETRYKFNGSPKKVKIDKKVMEGAIDLDAWISATFAQNEAKALEAVKELRGILPAPAAGALTDQSAGKTTSAAKPKDDDLLTSLVEEELENPTVEEATDAEFTEVAATPAPAPAPAPAAAEANSDDDDILAMLDDIGAAA